MIVTDLHNLLRYKLGDISLDESIYDEPFYKAEIISREKLHLLKQGIGKYITFKSFLSTTTNKSRALELINRTDIDHKKQAIVLFSIEMNDEDDIQRLVQPFANVTFLSCTSHEPEVLFSIGQVFKIRSMIQNEMTRVWTVYLEVLKANETEHLTNVTNYYLSKIVGKEIFYNGIQARVNYEPLTITTFVTLGDYYSSIIVKDYEKAELYYQKFLDEELESPDNFDLDEQPSFYYPRIHRLYYLARGHINLQLTHIRYEQGKYMESAEYNRKSHEEYLKLSLTLNDLSFLATIFNNRAKLYWKYIGKYEDAATEYLHALEMDRNNAEIFISIGLTQIFAEEYAYAFHSFSTALSMIQTLNETDYLSYGLIYRGLGQVYEKSGKIWQASSYYLQAEGVYKKSLPSNHELHQEIKNDIKRITTVKTNVHQDL